MKLIINYTNRGGNLSGFIRFNNGWFGKGASSNLNIALYDGTNSVTLNQIPTNTDVEYTLTYQNGVMTITDGTDTTQLTTTNINSITQISAQNSVRISNIRIIKL